MEATVYIFSSQLKAIALMLSASESLGYEQQAGSTGADAQLL